MSRFLRIFVRYSKSTFRDVTLTLTLSLTLALTLSACSPRMTAQKGSPYTGPIPDTKLSGHKLIRFNWEYKSFASAGKGQGVIRIAAPDSARLDLVFESGALGGLGPYAILIGSGPIRSPDAEALRDILPEAPLIWAAIGRLAVPPARDTSLRVQDGLITADIGTGPVWRAVFDGNRLTRLDRASRIGGDLEERVTRGANGTVTYSKGKNSLRLSDLREENAQPFSTDIWRN